VQISLPGGHGYATEIAGPMSQTEAQEKAQLLSLEDPYISAEAAPMEDLSVEEWLQKLLVRMGDRRSAAQVLIANKSHAAAA
jgi:hypothetical protein